MRDIARTPSPEEIAKSFEKWIDFNITPKNVTRIDPIPLHSCANEACRQCDAMIRRLRDMIRDDARIQFREYMDITQTDISTLTIQGRLGDLQRSAQAVYDEVTALSENFWRSWTMEGRKFLSETRITAWNLIRAVNAIELGMELTFDDPPLLEAQKKAPKKKPHWPDRAKAERDVRQKVIEICSSISIQDSDDGKSLMSYTMPSGKLFSHRISSPPGLRRVAEISSARDICWAALVEFGFINPEDTSDSAILRRNDINEWIKH